MQYLDPQDFRRLSAPQYQGFLDRVLVITNGMRRFTEMGFHEALRESNVDAHIRQSVAIDVLYEHYPIGSVFDYHGVPAMVIELKCQTMKYLGYDVVAAIKVGDAIENITIPQPLALALLWRRYNLKDETQ